MLAVVGRLTPGRRMWRGVVHVDAPQLIDVSSACRLGLPIMSVAGAVARLTLDINTEDRPKKWISVGR